MIKILLCMLMLGVVQAIPSKPCKKGRCAAIVKAEQRELEISRLMRKKISK